MTGFNMPPGVSPRDIPGNDAPDPSPEADAVLNILESAEGRCPPQRYCDHILEIVERIVAERDEYKRMLEGLQEEIARVLDKAISGRQAE